MGISIFHSMLKDNRGRPVKFADQAEAPKDEDVVMKLYREMPQLPMPNLYVVAGLLAGFWAYRTGRTFNMLMENRYSDVLYQLRRPDVLANKVVALKFMALPLALVPIGAVTVFATSPNGSMREHAQALKAMFSEPVRNVTLELREAMDPLTTHCSSGDFADFARRSQSVGREQGTPGRP